MTYLQILRQPGASSQECQSWPPMPWLRCRGQQPVQRSLPHSARPARAPRTVSELPSQHRPALPPLTWRSRPSATQAASQAAAAQLTGLDPYLVVGGQGKGPAGSSSQHCLQGAGFPGRHLLRAGGQDLLLQAGAGQVGSERQAAALAACQGEQGLQGTSPASACARGQVSWRPGGCTWLHLAQAAQDPGGAGPRSWMCTWGQRLECAPAPGSQMCSDRLRLVEACLLARVLLCDQGCSCHWLECKAWLITCSTGGKLAEAPATDSSCCKGETDPCDTSTSCTGSSPAHTQ